MLAKPQSTQRVFSRLTRLIPTPQIVVLRQHPVELVYTTLGSAAGCRILEQSLGQRIIGAGKACREIKHSLKIPDPFAALHQTLCGPLTFAIGIQLRSKFRSTPGAHGKHAQAAGIHCSRPIL